MCAIELRNVQTGFDRPVIYRSGRGDDYDVYGVTAVRIAYSVRVYGGRWDDIIAEVVGRVRENLNVRR